MEHVIKQSYNPEYHNDEKQLHRENGPAPCSGDHPDWRQFYGKQRPDSAFAVVIQNEFIAQIVSVDLLTHTGPIYSSQRDALAAAYNQGYDLSKHTGPIYSSREDEVAAAYNQGYVFHYGFLYNTTNLKNHLRSVLKKSGEFTLGNNINHCILKGFAEDIFSELYPGEKDNYNFTFLYTAIRITKKRKSTNPRSNLKEAVISPEHLELMHQSIKAVALKKHKLTISLEKELSFSALNKLANMLDIEPNDFIPVLSKHKVKSEVLRKIVKDFKY